MGTTDRELADSRALTVGPAGTAEIHAALEGERDGLPIYCCSIKKLRVDGRALPERMVLTPEEAGVNGARIEWTLLKPAETGRGWRRTRMPSGIGHWSHAVFDIHPEPAPGISATLGTARYAVAVALADAAGAAVHLEGDGVRVRENWEDPRFAPGFRVTRHGGDSVMERALGFAGIPFRADASRFEAIARVALAPTDLFAAAYEDVSGASFGTDPLPALDATEWSWLFEKVMIARRRSAGTIPFVGEGGRPIPWDEGGGVRSGDVLVVGGSVAFLEADDGDESFENADRVLHSSSGRLQRGTLAELPEGNVTVLRVRDLGAAIQDLADAGYGPLSPGPLWSTRARRAMTEFQRDRGLPLGGLPDSASVAALRDFVTQLDSASGPDSSR